MGREDSVKSKYLVTYKIEGDALGQEEIVAESIMAGAQNGVLVAFDYEPSMEEPAGVVPRMVRMFAPGTWTMVENKGPFIQIVPKPAEVQ